MAKIIREPEGFLRMLMSGCFGSMAATGIMVCVAWLFNPLFYNLAGRVLRSIFTTILPNQRFMESPDPYTPVPREERHSVELLEYSDEEMEIEKQYSPKACAWNIKVARIKLLAVTILMIVLHLVRPRSPYGHMSTTLPFTLFEGLFIKRSALCSPEPWERSSRFPLQDLVDKKFWIPSGEKDGGIGRGWSPGKPWWEVEQQKPSWLPEKETAGFAKYYRQQPKNPHPHPHPPHSHLHPHGWRGHHHHRGKHGLQEMDEPRPPGYDSVLDPLKISNLDQPILEEIRAVLTKSNVTIKHVVIMSLESTRKDVFPLVKGGPLERQLSKSRGDEAKLKQDEYASLAELSKMAEIMTGEDAGFGRHVNTTLGGLNVHGALTGSTFTLKSLLGSHCGVSPLPVDFLEELETEIYQPCIPQILRVMNTHLNPAGEQPWKNMPWKTAFMQAATNKFDRQQPFVEQLGFEQTIMREDIQAEGAKYPPKQPEINYFGYSEVELKPYIQDLFNDAEKNGERVFLSHITTSSHHPWATPREFGKQQRYWGGSKGGGTPWDRYLNSIKWGDNWITEFMQILKDAGVEDKTLVVMVGDHGFSFNDDSTAKTTYANAHINNFRVPLLFRHPALPRIQLNATVTSMSILPTILDILVTTDSLSTIHSTIAKDLLPEYEGQSLIREFIPDRDGRQAWNFGVVNPGGTHLSLVSSSQPFRLVMPICDPSAYKFSDLQKDPVEANLVEDWDGGAKLQMKVGDQYGDEAAKWVADAELVGEWMVWELRRRWGYWEGSRMEDRGPGHNDDGALQHDHWWNT